MFQCSICGRLNHGEICCSSGMNYPVSNVVSAALHKITCGGPTHGYANDTIRVCSVCGKYVSFEDRKEHYNAIKKVSTIINREGKIVGVKNEKIWNELVSVGHDAIDFESCSCSR